MDELQSGKERLTVTKTQAKKQIAEIKKELKRLATLEKVFNRDCMFHPTPYSKRRSRLVKMYWILKGAL
jgi:hypothetical protein